MHAPNFHTKCAEDAHIGWIQLFILRHCMLIHLGILALFWQLESLKANYNTIVTLNLYKLNPASFLWQP